MKTIGIDFGTTYCSLATYDGANVSVLVPKDDFPSCVVVSGDKPPDIATDAENHMRGGLAPHEDFIEDMKVMMGTDWRYPQAQPPHTPQSIATLMFLEMLDRAHLDPAEIRRAVITVSTTFSIAQRRALRLAAETAGLRNILLLPEPAAAFIGWRHFRGVVLDRLNVTRIIICDWGGGTLDLCYAIWRGGRWTVEDYDGLFLGGRNIDESVVSIIASQYYERFGKRLPIEFVKRVGNKEEWYQWFRMKNDVAKGIKELLSSKSAIDFSSLPIEIGAHYSELENTLVTKSRPTPLCDRIERIDFEKACKGQFDQIIEKIKKFLNRVLECDLVVLVGGSFLIPYVQNRLREELEKREIRVEVDKDHFWLRHFVVTGAAIYARKPTAYPEVRDRFTYEVGLRKWDGSFDKIIARNTPRQDFEIQCNLTADHNVADAEGEARFELWEYAGTDPVRGEGIYRVKEFPLAELSMDHREALYRGGLSATLKYDARRDIIDLKIGEEILMGEDSVIRERVVPDYLARDAQERLNRLLGSGVLPLGDEEHLEELRLLLELPKIRLVDYIRVCDALNAIEVTISRRSDQLNEHDL